MKQQIRGNEAIEFRHEKPVFKLSKDIVAHAGVIFNEVPREEVYGCDAVTHSTPEIERNPA